MIVRPKSVRRAGESTVFGRTIMTPLEWWTDSPAKWDTEPRGWTASTRSARTGQGVHEAFARAGQVPLLGEGQQPVTIHRRGRQARVERRQRDVPRHPDHLRR